MVKIVVASNGRISNPLITLDGRGYASRDEGCEAIYTRLYDVITGEGCEMVNRAEYDDLDAYIDACRAYIMREGWASEDGVTASVEEVR